MCSKQKEPAKSCPYSETEATAPVNQTKLNVTSFVMLSTKNTNCVISKQGWIISAFFVLPVDLFGVTSAGVLDIVQDKRISASQRLCCCCQKWLYAIVSPKSYRVCLRKTLPVVHPWENPVLFGFSGLATMEIDRHNRAISPAQVQWLSKDQCCQSLDKHIKFHDLLLAPIFQKENPTQLTTALLLLIVNCKLAERT